MGKPLLNAMFSLLAPAKINLYLKVLYKRPDGYHEIDTVMQAVSLFDRLTFYPHSKIRVQTKGHPIPEKDNLVTKALLLLQTYAGIKKGIRVVIDKKIPVAAGLGGGSSDAAAALLGARRLWQLPLSIAELSYLGAQVGSDVPFFFTSGQARARGRGEKLTRMALPTDYWIALICPRFSVSTPWTYRALKMGLTRKRNVNNLKLSWGFFPGWRKAKGEASHVSQRAPHFSNDLEVPVMRRFRDVEELKKALLAAGFGPVLMSGSGPAVWAIFPESPEGKNLSGQMRRKRAMLIKTMGQSGLSPLPKLFFVRPLVTCANAPIGDRSAGPKGEADGDYRRSDYC